MGENEMPLLLSSSTEKPMDRHKLPTIVSLPVLLTLIALNLPVVLGAGDIQYNGDGMDLQTVLDEAPHHATIVCDASAILTFDVPLVIRRPLTSRFACSPS